MTFSDDSVSVLERKFTDDNYCVITNGGKLCSGFEWENRYRGAWHAEDSLLTLSLAFTETTANRLRSDERMADGTFRMRYALQGSGALALSKLGEGTFLPEREVMDMIRE